MTTTDVGQRRSGRVASTSQSRGRLWLTGGDAAAVGCGLLGAVGLFPSLVPWWLAAGFGSLLILVLPTVQVYNSRLITSRGEELRRILQAGVRSLLVVGAVLALSGDATESRSLLVVFSSAMMGLLVEREGFRFWFRRRRRSGQSLWKTVLVADREGAKHLTEAFHANHTSPYSVVATIEPDRQGDHEALLTDVLSQARRSGARGVMVVESSLDTASTNFLVRGLLEADMFVDLASALANLASDRLATRNLGPNIATWITPRPRDGWRAHAKRMFDLAVAGAVLCLLAPVLGVIAVLVKRSSPGPILFRQERVGRHGESFHMLKFRSMVVDADKQLEKLQVTNEGSGPLFKMKDDPRVTSVGRLLRKTSLDELPQLINVIRNEMSLVGPRPALRSEMHEWHPDLYNRLEVQPGITGMWQVSGRSSTSFDEYMRLDLYYVYNWSLVEDLTIMLKTVPAVLSHDGAY